MAKSVQNNRKKVPPYISYKTFVGFLDGLRVVGVPTRLDRSLVPSMSGSNQALLFATLRYLSLITEKGAPAKDLDTLVNSKGDAHRDVWHRLLVKGYSNLFGSDFDLERTTTQELAEAFAREGVSSLDTVRKCVSFFTLAAKDAGIKLSPHIKPYAGRKHASRRDHETASEPEPFPRTLVDTNKNGSTDWQLLLSKFPDFDPTWPDELKKKWFDGFDRFSRALNGARTADDSASQHEEPVLRGR